MNSLFDTTTFFLEEYTKEEAEQFIREQGMYPSDFRIETHNMKDLDGNDYPVTVCVLKRGE